MVQAEHPTVKQWELRHADHDREVARPLDADALRTMVLEAGADDVGFVEIDRVEIADQRDDILQHMRGTRTLISYVVRMNREPIRATARSVANLEFHHTGEAVDAIARRVIRTLESRGHRASTAAMVFPNEMDRFPGKIWVISHKPVAVAAGLGRIGIHRNVIHPRFGNFVLLGTIVLDATVSEYSRPIDYNPCLDCKLCVAACPVGAIHTDGQFDFSACYTHNYREFMGGFTDWVEQVAESRNAIAYRKRVSDSETASLWQSLSFGANYKAAYCLSVCPAGEDVIGPYLSDRGDYVRHTVRPLQQKEETLYVLRNSDAEEHAARRFPHKRVKHVGNSLRPRSIDQFLQGLPLVFQRGKSAGIDATYHFTFAGDEDRTATIVIRDNAISVREGLHGKADLRIEADTTTWLGFLAGERNLLWALVRRKIRIKGSPRLLVTFGKCFPG